jgi:transcription initiation factor TFIIIB Brf1 subunit/transcription initiation factor TFIIB
MAYYPANVTKDWERFEYFIARYRPCPACAGKLIVLPRNAGAVDCVCGDCGCGVQVKFSRKGPKSGAPASSAKEWRKAVRTIGARRIWFVTGNFKVQRWFKYTECKRVKADRLRRPKGVKLADAIASGATLRKQERFSFRFPSFSKYQPIFIAA